MGNDDGGLSWFHFCELSCLKWNKRKALNQTIPPLVQRRASHWRCHTLIVIRVILWLGHLCPLTWFSNGWSTVPRDYCRGQRILVGCTKKNHLPSSLVIAPLGRPFRWLPCPPFVPLCVSVLQINFLSAVCTCKINIIFTIKVPVREWPCSLFLKSFLVA